MSLVRGRQARIARAFLSSLVALVLVWLVTACGNGADADLVPFADGNFRAELPDWNEDEADSGPERLTGVVWRGAGVWVHRFEVVPRLAVRELRRHIEGEAGGEVLSETIVDGQRRLAYQAPYEDATVRAEAAVTYCDGGSYAVIVASEKGDYDERGALFESVLASGRCEDPLSVPNLSTGRLGMDVNPAEDDYAEGIHPALRLAKETGVQVVHLQRSWPEIETAPGEFDWTWTDQLMGLHTGEGFEVSLVINVIHTAVRGPVPDDLLDVEFDDPAFVDRFTTFMLAYLERYPGEVRFLSIGNEVNDYFVNHRGEVPAYRDFFLAVKGAVASRYPELPVGMTFAYHDAERQDALDVIRELNVGDFVPYTLYVYRPGFRFDREPEELAGYVDRMLALADDKPMALAELGWNTASSLDGTEEDQAAFVRQAFRQLRAHRERIAYMTWFTLHDGQLENCRESAMSFIPHRPDLAEDAAFMTPFVDFICHLGLRESDGTPKVGWHTFTSEAQEYLESVELRSETVLTDCPAADIIGCAR